MNRNRLLMVLAALVLIGANAWRYWPDSDVAVTEAAAPLLTAQVSSFALKAPDMAVVGPAKRNLFAFVEKPPAPREKAAPVDALPGASGLAAAAPVKPLAAASSDALAQKYLLAAVAFREGGAQAFITESDRGYLVTVGDQLGERYRVESIGINEVTVRDSVSGDVSIIRMAAGPATTAD